MSLDFSPRRPLPCLKLGLQRPPAHRSTFRTNAGSVWAERAPLGHRRCTRGLRGTWGTPGPLPCGLRGPGFQLPARPAPTSPSSLGTRGPSTPFFNCPFYVKRTRGRKNKTWGSTTTRDCRPTCVHISRRVLEKSRFREIFHSRPTAKEAGAELEGAGVSAQPRTALDQDPGFPEQGAVLPQDTVGMGQCCVHRTASPEEDGTPSLPGHGEAEAGTPGVLPQA